MRSIFRVLCMAVCLILCCGCAAPGGADQPGAFTLQDGTRIDYTMDRKSVEAIVGEPDRVDTQTLDHDYVECYYDGDGFSAVFTPEGKLRAVKIDSTEIETFGGIHLGHTAKKVEEQFDKAQTTEMWTIAAFRGAENISADSQSLDDNCFWIYYIPDNAGKIVRIVLMDHHFITEGN